MQFEDRDRVVGEFRRGETKILISTDVLSRGFDVSQVRCQAAASATQTSSGVCAVNSSSCRVLVYCTPCLLLMLEIHPGSLKTFGGHGQLMQGC